VADDDDDEEDDDERNFLGGSNTADRRAAATGSLLQTASWRRAIVRQQATAADMSSDSAYRNKTGPCESDSADDPARVPMNPLCCFFSFLHARGWFSQVSGRKPGRNQALLAVAVIESVCPTTRVHALCTHTHSALLNKHQSVDYK
jgi:hypothetical protein